MHREYNTVWLDVTRTEAANFVGGLEATGWSDTQFDLNQGALTGAAGIGVGGASLTTRVGCFY